MKNEYIDELLKKDIKYYAHKKTKEGNSIRELLLSHMELTYEYYMKMEEYKGLDKIVENIVNNITRDVNVSYIAKEKVYELFKSAIYYHDIGKLNPNFQRVNMDNDISNIKRGSSEHSLISARIYLDAFKREIFESFNLGIYSKYDVKFLEYIVYYFSYIISRHHSNLNDMSEYLTKLSIMDLYGVYNVKFEEDECNSHFLDSKLKI